MNRYLPCLIFFIPLTVNADDKPLSLVERFVPGSEYRVITKVDLQGELSIPVEEPTSRHC